MLPRVRSGDCAASAARSRRAGQRSARECEPGAAEWRARSLGVVTLWGPWAKIDEALDYYEQEVFPPRTAIYWVDNTGSPRRCRRLREAADELSRRFPVTFIHKGEPYRRPDWAGYAHLERHQHVARLYNSVVPRVREDMTLFIEDDTIARAGDLRRLWNSIPIGSGSAIVAAVYRSRTSPDHCCCALRDARGGWAVRPRFDDIEQKLLPVNKTGGGFTLYQTGALKEVGAFRCLRDEHGRLEGWDGNLCDDLRALGWEILVDGRVKVDHRCDEGWRGKG